MDKDSGPEMTAQEGKAAAEEKPEVQKPTTSWIIPLVTAVVLAAVFCAYYFVYVGSRREYLANRNFRALALLGEQLQQRISVHGNILEFCASLAADANATHRQKENLSHFLLVRPEDRDLPLKDREREALKDYLKYLAPSFDLTEVPSNYAQARSRLRVERHNDQWELILTAFPHKGTDKYYQGSLKIDGLMESLVASLPFDDVLLVSKEGTIVYHSKQTGPRFTTLSSLLQSQLLATDTKPAKPAEAEAPKSSANAPAHPPAEQDSPVAQNADPMWRARSLHMTDVMLAGTRYKLFLQPVLVSSFSKFWTQAEPASEWVLCGLTASAALDWEALSLSYTFFIWLIVVFFAIWTSYKVLKIFFMNQWERLRLREFGVLGVSLVLLASVLTFSLLELDFRTNDDTDARLRELGTRIVTNVHDELRLMSEQLTAWCNSGELQKDLAEVVENNKEIIRNAQTEGLPLDNLPMIRPPKPDKYPFVSNAFWTDDDGHQIVKWSMTEYVTPMIDVSQLSSYVRPESHLNSERRAFHFTSILPPNKLEYLGTIGMRSSECATTNRDFASRDDVADGSAFLVSQPLSVIDPILPYGYGFAIVDQAGTAIFHSDKTRNGREDFLVESDGNKELLAAFSAHSSLHALALKYKGKDYRAVVVPPSGVSQAPWSLIVYRDMTSVRTVNLQVMSMAATLLFVILAGPVVLIALWCALRRPLFAPEWLWPNPRRLVTYTYQIRIYVLLIALFLVLCFWGSSEGILVACAATPFATLVLTCWCFRLLPSPVGKTRRGGRRSVTLIASAAALALVTASTHWIHPQSRLLLTGLSIAAASLFLAGVNEALSTRVDRWRALHSIREKRGNRPERERLTYVTCYFASVLLLVFLIGVLVPMALFRVSLNVERRLAIKQAQLHLASSLANRWTQVLDLHDKAEISESAWCAYQSKAECKAPGNPWSWIVPVDLVTRDGKLPVAAHSSDTKEAASFWFRRILYSLHHDYNEASAEMLGAIQDRGKPPDWSWEETDSAVTLRWHGLRPPAAGSTPPSESADDEDLVLASSVRTFSWSDLLTYSGMAAVVMLAICGLFLALARKVFRLDIAPLRMTGTRQVAEALRDGENVLVLIPPALEWHLDTPKWTIDLAQGPLDPKWAENLDLASVPVNIVIEVLHFEITTHDAEIDSQKLVLLDRLTHRDNTQLAVIMTVPVSPEDYRRMFPDLVVVDLREEPLAWQRQYAGPAQELIWTECAPMAALWPLGAQLAKDINAETVYTEDTIASEMLERADPYYRLIWQECSNVQKFVLSQLAEDGVLNPTNGRAIRQLVRRGLIAKDPQFRIMNESFRRFLRSATTARLKREWLNESRRSGWGQIHGAFFTTMTLLGIFLLATQSALWQSAAAYVTTALGALGTLSKLADTFGAKGSTEKPS